jgi:hypothetical protein
VVLVSRINQLRDLLATPPTGFFDPLVPG